jgi:phenylalanyl-tRNA synthetase alpha chain
MMSLLDQLTTLELKVLPIIQELSKKNSRHHKNTNLRDEDHEKNDGDHASNVSFEEIMSHSGLKDIEVMRAVQWLSNKEMVLASETVSESIVLDKNGLLYAKKGLPELQLLKMLSARHHTMAELEERGLSKEEINISIGELKKKLAIELKKDTLTGKQPELTFYITENGKKLLQKESLEEHFLKSDFPKDPKKLAPEDKYALDNLIKRKEIVRLDSKKLFFVSLTDLGRSVKIDDSYKNRIEKLTPQIIRSGEWKGKSFRSFDLTSPVPKRYPGRVHFVNQAIRYIKEVWLELGFEEMTGNHIHTAFRDLDALFVPQDHPAREMQDTFYIKDPKSGNIPKEVGQRVKDAHETGANTGSTGWKYKFSDDVAKQNLLRTHTTVLSGIAINNLKKEDFPKKYFSVGKVYRNEALDWKHLFEFYQVEGIVIDPNANLKHLVGYITTFYKKLGYEKIRIRPSHFPYTEPSIEIEVFHPVRKEWIELGGAGIFRPEVVVPLLGIDVPVLAWGQGMERGIMEYFALQDLRDLYRNDLRQMKEMKYWLK